MSLVFLSGKSEQVQRSDLDIQENKISARSSFRSYSGALVDFVWSVWPGGSMSCRVSPPRMALKSRLTLDSCGTVLDIIEPKYIYTHRASCPRQRSFFGTCQKWQGYWHLEHRNIPSKTSFHRPSHILNRFKYSLGVTEDAWTNSTVLMSLLFLETTVMNCFFECCWRFPSLFLIDSATKRGASCST